MTFIVCRELYGRECVHFIVAILEKKNQEHEKDLT